MIPEGARQTAALTKANGTAVHGGLQASALVQASHHNCAAPPPYDRPARQAQCWT